MTSLEPPPPIEPRRNMPKPLDSRPGPSNVDERHRRKSAPARDQSRQPSPAVQLDLLIQVSHADTYFSRQFTNLLVSHCVGGKRTWIWGRAPANCFISLWWQPTCNLAERQLVQYGWYCRDARYELRARETWQRYRYFDTRRGHSFCAEKSGEHMELCDRMRRRKKEKSNYPKDLI